MKLFLIVPILLLSYSLSGQTDGNIGVFHPDSVYRPLTVDLPEIQVMGYRTVGQLKSTAGSITVIPIDRLENSAVSITAALSTVPGLVMQEGTLGTIKLTLRGIGSRYPYGTKKIKLFLGDFPGVLGDSFCRANRPNSVVRDLWHRS